MTLLRALVLCALLCMHVAAAQPSSASLSRPDADALAQREVLLMLRVAPAHYRPDRSYGNDYRNVPGRAARRRVADAIALAHGLQLHEEWPMPVLGVDCFVLDAVDAASARREAQALALDPRVESAQPMQLFHLLVDPTPVPDRAGSDPLYAAQPAAKLWHLDELHAQATGKGVRVAVIDSGVAVEHPDLRGQVALQRDFVGGRGSIGEAHGTAVAGVIAARDGNGVGIAGIAPQARLLALRACWQITGASAACSSFTLAQALQAAIDARAQVLNLSLAGPRDRLLARLLDVALTRGIDIVAAVDTNAPDGGFPASHRGVLAVEGLGQAHAPSSALRAPAVGIPAPTPAGGWGLVSGNSFAAAQVSGLVALLRQERPRLGAAQLLTLLEPASGLRSPPEPPPAIDACAVMLRTAGHCVCACKTVSAAR